VFTLQIYQIDVLSSTRYKPLLCAAEVLGFTGAARLGDHSRLGKPLGT